MTIDEARSLRRTTLIAVIVMVAGLYLMSDYSPLNHDSPANSGDDSALLETIQMLQDLSDASDSGLFVPDLSAE